MYLISYNNINKPKKNKRKKIEEKKLGSSTAICKFFKIF